MRFTFATLAAVFAVAFLAPNALADSGDDGEGIETHNAQGSWVATSRESDDWAASPAPASPRSPGSSFAVMQPAPTSPGVAVPAAVDTAVRAENVAPQSAGASIAMSAMPVVEPVAPAASVRHDASNKVAPIVHADDRPEPSSDPHQGLLGVLRIGALAGVGAPSIFSGEGLAKIGDWVGVTGDYGSAPSLSMPIGNGGATITQTTVSAGARVFPFRGAFFVGGSVGQQTVSAKVTQSAEGVTGGANFSTKAMFVEPQIGLLYRFAFGLAIGCDAGVQIPVSASGQSSTSENMPLPGPLSAAMNYAEKGVIPSLNILRLGYVL